MSDSKTGVDRDNFELNIDEEYLCPICFGVMRDACQLNCGHKFCKYCISSWLTGKTKVCPLDQRPADSNSIKDANAIRRIIEKFKLKCPNWLYNCRQMIEYKDLESHEINCSFAQKPTSQQSGVFSLFTTKKQVPITIVISTNTVYNKPFECSANNTVGELKQMIFESGSIKVKEQNLVFGSKVLKEDNKTLSEYGLKNGSFLYFIEKYDGGD